MTKEKSIQIKKVESNSELQQIFNIRNQVFVIEQGVSENEEYDEFENHSDHFIVLESNLPIGCARVRKTNIGYKIERFAIIKEYRQQKIGELLLLFLLNYLKPTNETIYLHAQIQVEGFYSKYGFISEGSEFLEAGIKHIKMFFKESA